MNIRTDWTIRKTAKSIRDFAALKADFHKKRKEFWESEQARITKEITESGVTIVAHESIYASSYSNTLNGQAASVVAQINPAMKAALEKSNEKAKHHETMLTDFRRWLDFMARARDDDEYELTRDDALHFGMIE